MPPEEDRALAIKSTIRNC